MTTLSIRTTHDGLLACVAPLALAAAAGTALMVDLDPDGPRYPGTLSLASLVGDGPRRTDLSPQRAGLAVLRNGGIDAASSEPASRVLAALAKGWPHLVLRVPPGSVDRAERGVVPVVPVLPGALATSWDGPAVRQPTGLASPPAGPGVFLPRPRRSTLAALLRGTVPRSRWVRAWRPVWELPW